MLEDPGAFWSMCVVFVRVAWPVVLGAALVSTISGWVAAKFGVQDAMLASALRWLAVGVTLYFTVANAVSEVRAFTLEMWSSELLGCAMEVVRYLPGWM